MGRKKSETCADKQSENSSHAAHSLWARRRGGYGPDMPGEEWRNVPDFPGYQASNTGRVRSAHVILKAIPYRTGHLVVCPSINGKQAPYAVHRMVCAAFKGPCPEGHECGHIDGDPANNRSENLGWITRLENQRDRKRHGTTNKGERNGRAKLTDAQVTEIRRRGLAGEKQAVLALEFGVNKSHVSNIVTGKRCKTSQAA